MLMGAVLGSHTCPRLPFSIEGLHAQERDWVQATCPRWQSREEENPGLEQQSPQPHPWRALAEARLSALPKARPVSAVSTNLQEERLSGPGALCVEGGLKAELSTASAGCCPQQAPHCVLPTNTVPRHQTEQFPTARACTLGQTT